MMLDLDKACGFDEPPTDQNLFNVKLISVM